VSSRRPQYAVAVDLAVLTVREGALHVLLVERGKKPYLGQLALPGGFVEPDEDLDAAAERELEEETGLRPGAAHLEQLRSYGAVDRDPRMRVITIAYLVLMPDLPLPKAGGDARAARWVPVDEALSSGLAFDHDVIFAEALERARSTLEYSTRATAFCGPEFTISDLRQVYETVWGRQLDPGNFSRKVTGVDGFLISTGRRSRDGGRPAALYRAGPATVLHPAILREGR
jgi:8-oxo-dGTP diphosphatase